MSGTETRYCDWIAVDWGTTHLRAWAMLGTDPTAPPRAKASSDKGMNTLARTGFERALLDLVDPWLGRGVTPVVACGMVGARQGWVEAPYRAVPAPPQDGVGIPAPTQDSRLSVRILPGLKQTSPPDVMRGEETQIAGWIALNPDFDGILCLPGTHSKWVHVSAGEVVSFRTFMTGELFALLSESSVLRHSIADQGWQDDAFAESVSETLSRPESLAGRLFGLRANSLIGDLDRVEARARLSGLLIGAELAAARPYWLGQRVVLIGAESLSAVYATALSAQGVTPERAEAGSLTRAGLAAAHSVMSTA